jgi:8-oxo-dGTP diphosphatase
MESGEYLPIDVVAGILWDSGRRHVLMARKAPGRSHSGHWEFPGGKVEPGETHADALAREFLEELGIGIEAGSWLLSVPFVASGRSMVLQVYEIQLRKGSPCCGPDHDQLAWVPPGGELPGPIAPADRAVWQRLSED